MTIGGVPARGFQILAFVLAGVAEAYGTSCGSVAVASSCSIVQNGNTQYVFSNFVFVNSAGPQNYTSADIAIDIGPDAGNAALLTFSKSGGGAFFANSASTNSFLFTYDVAISAVQPGTVQFAAPFFVSLGGFALNSGLAGDQMTLTNSPNATTCLAILASGSTSAQAPCNTLPLNTTITLNVANSIHLIAPGGSPSSNASMVSFSNSLDATFTGAPEPGTWSLIVAGLVAVAWRRWKTAFS